jgi:tRNA threonylcarbamoyladenosine biosynthesis protein TsaE
MKIAYNLAKNLVGGDIVALYGDLGSGKTVFTKGLAKYFGIKETVVSPTFVTMKCYEVDKNAKKANIFMHADCYRLKSNADANSVGLSDFLGAPDTISVVEWPEKIQKKLPNSIIKIGFDHVDDTTRKIFMDKV